MPDLITEDELEGLAVVANSTMNRGRGLSSYDRELGFSVSQLLGEHSGLRWLDLCCGEGRALGEASARFPGTALWGLDLVDAFRPSDGVRFAVGSWRDWSCPVKFDLITCVHGLHYFGDKLGSLHRISQWLSPEGRLLGHLDLKSLRRLDGRSYGRMVIGRLRSEGWSYDRRRVLQRVGPAESSTWEFLGADPTAGPNFTGQPAVDSYYL